MWKGREESGLLRCYTLSTGKQLPAFRRKVLRHSATVVLLNKKVQQYFRNSLNIYQSSRRNKREDLSLYKQNYGNLKSGGNLKNRECENFET